MQNPETRVFCLVRTSHLSLTPATATDLSFAPQQRLSVCSHLLFWAIESQISEPQITSKSHDLPEVSGKKITFYVLLPLEFLPLGISLFISSLALYEKLIFYLTFVGDLQ